MRILPVSILAWCAAAVVAAAVSPDEAEFFEKNVRPVLVEHCIRCHGPEKQKAELRLDSKAALLKGSDIGPVVVAGKPEESSFIKSIRHEGDSKMPEKDPKLPDGQIAALTEWVRMGLPWPETDGAKSTSKELAAANHWSFQPVRKTGPPAVEGWGNEGLDRFILEKLRGAKLTPSAPADRRTLLRRVTYGLTGLPPTAAEVTAFQSDTAPDAFAKVVDRLLASPRYGERWARHWLDVARYADTKGYVFQEERRYPYAYTYRDWVIRALNEDLPYDKFLTLQIAADHVAAPGDAEPLAALGFLTLGRRFLNNQHDIIDDRIDVVARGTMGLTVTCARCHDHKFDPISAKDYYALHGVFASSMEPKNAPLLADSRDPGTQKEYSEKLAKKQGEVDGYLRERQTEGSAVFSFIAGAPVWVPEERVEKIFNGAERDKLTEHRRKVDELNAGPLAPPRPMAMADEPKPHNSKVFIRGNPGRPGDEAPRGFLTVLSRGEPKPFTKGSGRLELAQAIVSPENPLTARVIVNRLWAQHFGAGLVRTPGDFGVKGEAPTHPELLDFLAARFMEGGWSLKKLHREMLLSATYQQASDRPVEATQLDPENRLLSHMNRRRLDWEATRDSLLAATGQLDLAMGGRSVELTEAPYAKRRAVYGFIDRQNLPGMFRTFDFASPDATSPQRHLTTVPQQALFMLNSPFVVEGARAVAASVEGERVVDLYLRVLGRLPGEAEAAAGLRFLSAVSSPEAREEPVWQYGWGRWDATTQATSFTPLPHWTGSAWQGSAKLPDQALGYALLNPGGGHPGDAAHSVILRWTAPRDAVLSLSGTLAKPSEGGDGVQARVIAGGNELAQWIAGPKGSVATSHAGIALKRGETLDLVVECIGDATSDTFTWAPVLRAEGGEWDAVAQFAGPVPAGPKPLNAWEKYAQVLLASNEFVFVD